SDELERRARIDQPAVIAAATALSARVARVTGAAGAPPHAVEERVLLAVDRDVDQVEDVARGLPLAPELVSRGRPEHRPPGAQGLAQRLGASVADEEHLARVGVLQDNRDHVLIALRDAPELLEVDLGDGAFLERVRL